MSESYAIIPAAGLSTRMGSTTSGQARKPMLELAGAPILIHTLRCFEACAEIQEILIPVRREDRSQVEEQLAAARLRQRVRTLEGGNARQDSVWNAVQMLSRELGEAGNDVSVLIHDAVRPFLEARVLNAVLTAAQQHPAVIVAIPAVDTIKQVERVGAEDNRVTATLPRERVVLAQTPQVFRLGLLLRAYTHAHADGFYATDEAALLEHLGEDVFVVPGSPRNWKITTPADLPLAEMVLSARSRAELGLR
ncbi:MAG: 2-C-methyl-D-erythritol 4-phosphate cytidylyltransferase [Terriglobales bacterium]